MAEVTLFFFFITLVRNKKFKLQEEADYIIQNDVRKSDRRRRRRHISCGTRSVSVFGTCAIVDCFFLLLVSYYEGRSRSRSTLVLFPLLPFTWLVFWLFGASAV